MTRTCQTIAFAGILFGRLLSGGPAAFGADWYVGVGGLATNDGTKSSPWDLESTLQSKHSVKPGDIVWLSAGTYRHPNRAHGAMGYDIRLAGSAEKPIQVRAIPGEHVTLDGGANIQPPSTFLWLRELEIIVSENLNGSRRIDEPGSAPKSYDRPWGGLNIYSGTGCKFINLIIHDNAQGVSWWAGSKDSELSGCVIYDNGWDAPDRGHGHAIYTQNDDGVKTISNCIMIGGHGYTLHAYGSSRADVNNYLVVGNIFYGAGPFLIGGGKPSHGIRVWTNYFYGVSARLGYNAPYNENCEVLGNLVANASLAINNYKQVINEGNLIVPLNQVRPTGTKVQILPNQYDSRRAHVVIFNWEKKPQVELSLGQFLKNGETYRLLNPRDVFGKPIATGRYDGPIFSPSKSAEFAAFILAK